MDNHFLPTCLRHQIYSLDVISILSNSISFLSMLNYDIGTKHRPCSRQVTVWIECHVVIHPPPSMYPKAGNGALRGQSAITYHCQMTVLRSHLPCAIWSTETMPHQKISQRVQVVKITVNLCFCNLHFFVHPTLTPLQLTSGKLRSGRKHWSPYELERGNCNYCHPNMGVGKSNCTDDDLLENINMMVQ